MTEFTPPPFIVISIGMLWVVCMIIMEVIRQRSPTSIGGIREWMLAIFLLILGSGLISLRGKISLFFGSVVSMMCPILAMCLICCALRAFFGRPPVYRLLGPPLALVAGGLAWFTYGSPDFLARVAVMVGINIPLLLACHHEVRRHGNGSQAERVAAYTLLFMAAVNAIRLLTIVVGNIDASPEAMYLNQRLYHTMNQLGMFALTITFVLMIDSKVQENLIVIAAHDGQTGAYGRNAFFDLLGRELNRTQRSGAPLTLMMIDLDNFKKINDTWGHQTGDRVIADFVAIAKATLRDYDALGRFGGDEFMILLPDTALDEARNVADRIRSQCAAPDHGGVPPYSISIGMVCTGKDGRTVEQLVGAADQALYRAKKAGRNRIESESVGQFAAGAMPPAIAGAD